MPTYVALIDWTDQGVSNFKDTVDRYEAAESAFESLGVRFRDVLWTLGTHDMVTTVEAPDDETLAAALLSVAAQGNVRTTTLRAFSREEMRTVIGKVA
ncbi:MAG: GYD domain-containing protein [Thermoleophilaceae bacterium]